MTREIIRKGNHYPEGINFGIITKDYIEYEFTLPESCSYDVSLLPIIDRMDLNKLPGFRDFWNQNISARPGWRYMEEGKEFEITTYIHDGGPFVGGSEKVIGYVKAGEKCKISIHKVREGSNKYYVYTFNGLAYRVKVNNLPGSIMLKQFFYFGGNNPAPHDMIAYFEY